MAIISIMALAIVLTEHRGNGLLTINTALVRETFAFSILMPGLIGIMLGLLERARHVSSLADKQEWLSRQLAQTRNWVDLIRLLVRIPNAVAPVVRAVLMVYDPVGERFELAAQWESESEARQADEALESGKATVYRMPPTSAFCHTCALAQSGTVRSTVPCYHNTGEEEQDIPNGYGLPLVLGERVIALLHFNLVPDATLSADQMQILNGLSPAMALAVEAARPQRTAMIQAEATEAERRRIARDLHDSLGQNLAYLRLKLDMITGDDALHEIDAVRGQLEQMREVASEAYNQVRSTLTELRPRPVSDLTTLLLNQARAIAQRANFLVQYSAEGQARPADPAVQRQVIDILHEGMTNVAKHASAHRVSLHMAWGEDTLTVHLSDDGQGFDVTSAKEGHYGLDIMRERAAEINGQLTLSSHPGEGTELTLQVPLRAPARAHNLALSDPMSTL